MSRRILYLYTQVYRADSTHGVRTAQILTMLKKNGYTIDLLTLPGGDIWSSACYSDLYYTPRLPWITKLSYYGYGVLRCLATFWMLLLAIRLSLKHDYLVVHAVDRSMHIAQLIAWLTHTGLIVEWRDDACRHIIQCGTERRFHKVLKQADLIISDQAFTLDQLRKMPFSSKLCWIPLLPEVAIKHIPYVPCTIPQNHTDRTPFHVTVLADYSEGPHLCACLNVLHILKQHYPQLHFSIVGGSVSQSKMYRHRMADCSEASAFDFLGALSIDKLNALLAESEIIVLPGQDNTSIPIALLNAMRAGRAIVAHKSAAYTSLLTPSTAMLSDDYEGAFIEAFSLLYKHPDLRRKLAQVVQLKIETERPIQHFEDNLKACYAYTLNRLCAE